ncbi:flagellar hook protein FlgE [Halomonas ventosae]|uniref:Flagellar hook protein FlgE n=1 Tax=Halomonas ventosae TaxID=229007 RepID=A0A4R6ZTV5_9GAMM|nr:flagellar hook protein FlgE [Halomonas ventosae]TDR56095.1 flagellar hook protein FlgE [Halomonas ventosae]
MSFSQALSGLNAASSSLGVLGNNIANAQTVGFKGSNAQFADVFANAQVGLGTRVSDVVQDFSDGNLESTGRTLDLAVSGQGFFRFMQDNQVVYSRNGQLGLTPDGYLTNSSGARVMGYGLDDPTAVSPKVQRGAQPEVLQVTADEMPAQATSQIDMTLNLDARNDAANPPNQVTLATGTALDYHYSNNMTVYDSLGNPRSITVYYQKVADNTWTGTPVLEGEAALAFNLAFDTNGTMTTPAAGAMPPVTFAGGGDVDDLQITFNLAGTTQYGNESTTSALTQNGFTSGALVGISIEEDGTILRNYTNEQSRPAGQIALASFRNEEGLRPYGDNAWLASTESGGELLGSPTSGSLGSIASGVVETSNVDMAKQLVEMIVAQRAYQANSQTIKTQDELLQTAINLR